MKNWEELESELLSDSEFKKEYDALEPYYQLASQLIKARAKKGLSQKQLAEKIGTKQSAIARMESGDYNPSMNMLRKVAEATGAKLEINLQSW